MCALLATAVLTGSGVALGMGGPAAAVSSIEIVTPTGGSFAADVDIPVFAYALDDGDWAPTNDITWSSVPSDPDVENLSGNADYIPAGTLKPGTYTLYAETTDLDSNALSDSVTFTVSAAMCNGLPVNLMSDGTGTITGTAEDDVILGTDAGETITAAAAGTNTICAGDGSDVVNGGDGIDTIYAGAGADNASGDAGNDTIWGEAGNDTLNGNAGTDTIDGGDGADIINGGNDGDTVSGGTGNDQVSGGGGRHRQRQRR